MNNLKELELNVIYSPPATEYKPVDGRKYCFAIANKPGESHLYIGYEYDCFPFNHKVREEMRAEWIPHMGQYVLCVKIQDNNDHLEEHHVKILNLVSQQEITNSLSSIMYGDRAFFINYPWLLDSPIYIHFQSKNDDFNKIVYYGTPRQYLNGNGIAVKT